MSLQEARAGEAVVYGATLLLLSAMTVGCPSSPTGPGPREPYTGVWAGIARSTGCAADDFRWCSRTAPEAPLELRLIQAGNTISGEISLTERSTVPGAGQTTVVAALTGAVSQDNQLSLAAAFRTDVAPYHITAWETHLTDGGCRMEGTFGTYRNSGYVSGPVGLTMRLTYELVGVRRRAVLR